MNTKKNISCLLVAAILAGMFTSCQNSGNTSSSSTSGSGNTNVAEAESETVETTEEEARKAIPDDLPERDFEGYEYRILTYQPEDYEIEELTGDVVEDAIFDRNLRVNERFNVDVTAVKSASIDSLDKELKDSVVAGDNSYDIAIPHQIISGTGFITSHSILTWNDVPYVNTEKPWWNQTINTTTNILGQQYYMAGYVTMPTPFCMFINKDLAANYNLGDIYQVVRDKKWTMDVLKDVTAAVSSDLNGDGLYDSADQWGITFNNDNTTLNFMYACGIRSVILEDGKPVPNTYNDTMVSFIESLYDLVYNDNRTLFTDYNNQWNIGAGGFKDGRIMIFCLSVGDLVEFRDSEINIGVIPYPMWDENQDGYHTHVDAYNGMLCIPKTADNLERTGIVIEALAAETYKDVIPAYYDVTLGTKLARDADTVEMMDIIFDSVVYDFGYIFDHWNGCTWTPCNMMVQGTTDVASYWKSIENKVTQHYDELYEAVEEDIAMREE